MGWGTSLQKKMADRIASAGALPVIVIGGPSATSDLDREDLDERDSADE